MKKITVSAPGKLMLLGEHAVVYGQPCIVTAVGQRMKATVELTDESIFHLDAPDVQVTDYKKPMEELGVGDIPKGAKFVEIAVYNYYNRYNNTKKGGVRISTSSEFSSQFGFGSSSASTVCVIKALSELTNTNLDNKSIFDLAYRTVLDIQGKGSGFDVAAAVFGGTLYFVNASEQKSLSHFVIGGKIIKPLKINNLPLIVGYSGIKFDTVRLIDEVAKKAKKYPSVVDNIYDQIARLVDLAQKAILKSDFATLGELMNFNEGYLSALGVEGKKLADMIYGARDTGAYGAKLSGGGIGDCMIALAPEDKTKAVKDGVTSAGGQVIEIEANVEGVRIDG